MQSQNMLGKAIENQKSSTSMNAAFNKIHHSRIRNNPSNSTKIIGAAVVDHDKKMIITPSLIQSMMAASSPTTPTLCSPEPSPIVPNRSPNDMKPIQSDSSSESEMAAPSRQLRDLPPDAFEPVPLGGRTTVGRTSTPSFRNQSLLESLLDQTLFDTVTRSYHDNINKLNEPFTATNKLVNGDLWKVNHPTDILEPTPITEMTNNATKTSIPVSQISLLTHKPSEDQPSLLKVRKRSPFETTSSSSLLPKRRRRSNDGDEPSSVPRIRGHHEKLWTEQFEALISFKELKGHCLVPHTYPGNPVLSRWVKRQRYQYKLKMTGKVSTMTDARIQKLEDIGFVWDSHASAWVKRWKELKEYREKHGDCNVPSNYRENPELAVWIKCQRRQYSLFWSSNNKSSSMTFDRMQALNELGFNWKARDQWFLPPGDTQGFEGEIEQFWDSSAESI